MAGFFDDLLKGATSPTALGALGLGALQTVGSIFLNDANNDRQDSRSEENFERQLEVLERQQAFERELRELSLVENAKNRALTAKLKKLQLIQQAYSDAAQNTLLGGQGTSNALGSVAELLSGRAAGARQPAPLTTLGR